MGLKELLGDKYKENLTLEELESLLEGKDIGDVGAVTRELNDYKNRYDKASSEAAKFKKELRDKQSDEEKSNQQRADELETLKQERDTYKAKVEIAEHRAKYLALGYEETMATETAQALYEGTRRRFTMNNSLKENLANLIKVPTFITLAAMIVYVSLSLNGRLDNQFITEVTKLVLIFYFGSKAGKVKAFTNVKAAAEAAKIEEVKPVSVEKMVPLAPVEAPKSTYPN